MVNNEFPIPSTTIHKVFHTCFINSILACDVQWSSLNLMCYWLFYYSYGKMADKTMKGIYS